MMMRKIFETLILCFLIVSALLPRFSPPDLYAQEWSRGAVSATVEAARSAGIQDTLLNRILTLSVDYQISSNEVVNLLDILRSAQVDGLPIGPLVAKLEEGLAKRAAPAAIAAAMERQIEDYRYVRSLIGTVVSDDSKESISDVDLTILAGSLSGGLSRHDLALFLREAPAAPISMLAIAAENLALMKQIGFEEKHTRQILLTGLRLKCFTPSWRYLSRVIVLARKRGISDLEITEATIGAMKDKSDLRDLMATLEFTGRDLRRGPATGRPNMQDR
jgi:hypothetical protein